MDLLSRFEEMSLVDKFRHNQVNDGRNVSFTARYLKEDKLSVIRANKREANMELSIQLSKA